MILNGIILGFNAKLDGCTWCPIGYGEWGCLVRACFNMHSWDACLSIILAGVYMAVNDF